VYSPSYKFSLAYLNKFCISVIQLISHVISSSHSLSAVARKVNKSVNIYSRNDLSQVFRPLSYKISSLNVKGLNVLMTLLAAYIPIVVTDRVGVVPTDKNHCFGSFSVSKAKKSKLQKEYNEVNEFNESENIKKQVNKYPKLLNISDLSTVSSWRTSEILTDYTKEMNELRHVLDVNEFTNKTIPKYNEYNESNFNLVYPLVGKYNYLLSIPYRRRGWIRILILLSGDVEKNPGPGPSQDSTQGTGEARHEIHHEEEHDKQKQVIPFLTLATAPKIHPLK